MTKMNGFDLFADIDLSSSDLLDPKEENTFDDLFSSPVNQNDLFGESKQTQVKVEQKEIPVVQVKVNESVQAAPVVETPNKKAPAKKKDAVLTKNLKDQIKKKEDRKVDGTWEVAYAARRCNPPHEMTLEELRQWLELDYPELSKERCRITIEEDKKLIVPIVSGAKNG